MFEHNSTMHLEPDSEILARPCWESNRSAT